MKRQLWGHSFHLASQLLLSPPGSPPFPSPCSSPFDTSVGKSTENRCLGLITPHYLKTKPNCPDSTYEGDGEASVHQNLNSTLFIAKRGIWDGLAIKRLKSLVLCQLQRSLLRVHVSTSVCMGVRDCVRVKREESLQFFCCTHYSLPVPFLPNLGGTSATCFPSRSMEIDPVFHSE